MGSNTITDAGGIVLCLSGLTTAVFLTQDVTFGFILPILHVMNIAIGITAAGLVALSKPRMAPIAGVVAIGLALDTFLKMYHEPIWALPAIVGGVLCIAGAVSSRVDVPRPQWG